MCRAGIGKHYNHDVCIGRGYVNTLIMMHVSVYGWGYMNTIIMISA
jgi:hypothetical protein